MRVLRCLWRNRDPLCEFEEGEEESRRHQQFSNTPFFLYGLPLREAGEKLCGSRGGAESARAHTLPDRAGLGYLEIEEGTGKKGRSAMK